MRLWQEQGLIFLNYMPTEGKKIIDFGCGNGWASLYFKHRKGVVTALDIEKKPPENLIKAQIPYITSLKGGENFDFIWCHHVLEHNAEPIKLLMRLRKIGMELWLATPKFNNIYSFGHLTNYNMPTLIEHLRQGGWDTEKGSYCIYESNLWVVIRPYNEYILGEKVSDYPLRMAKAIEEKGSCSDKDIGAKYNWKEIEDKKLKLYKYRPQDAVSKS